MKLSDKNTENSFKYQSENYGMDECLHCQACNYNYYEGKDMRYRMRLHQKTKDHRIKLIVWKDEQDEAQKKEEYDEMLRCSQFQKSAL